MSVAQRITLYNARVEPGHLALTGFISRVEWMMERNLAKISQDEMDKVNVDLAAAGVAF